MKKVKKKEIAQTKEGKLKRSKNKHDKIREELKQDILSQSSGMTYETGIALKSAIKDAKHLTSSDCRNPKGTLKDEWKCPYWHPNFCETLGHKSARSPQCGMYKSDKSDRDDALQKIMDEHIERELQKQGNLGKWITSYESFLSLYF